MKTYDRVVWNVWSFHGQRDAVKCYAEQDAVIEPLFWHEPNAQLSESAFGIRLVLSRIT